MKLQKKIKNIFATLFLLNLVHAQDNIEEEKPTEIILTPGPIVGKYNKNDLDEIYDESSIEIQCTGITCNSSSDNVLLDEGKVTISNPGTYILGGELNGQLNIAVSKEDTVHLILRNVTISSGFGPAIYGEKCKKVIITTEGENTISDSINYLEDTTTSSIITTDEIETDIIDEVNKEIENNETEDKQSKPPNACIFIKSNLTFNGKGTLNVHGNFDEGIRSKKNLKVVSGKINVISEGNGIKAKESISIKDGEINVDSVKTGIKVTKDTEPEEGFIVIDGGNIFVKAIKDGIHAETHLTVNDGNIKIIDCEEGLEAQMIDIVGGDIYIDASDDGINASRIGAIKESTIIRNDGQNDIPIEESIISDDYNLDEQVYLRITGGKVDVRVEGPDLDGIDSNGSLYIGGNSEVYVGVVYGGTFGGMAAVDSDGFKSINGNTTALITGSGNLPLQPGAPGYTENPENGIKGTSGSADLTVEDILRLYPDKTREEAEIIVDLVKENLENGQKIIYDKPESCSYFQPYLRVIIDIQLEGIPILIKDSNDKILIEHKPRAQFGIIFFTSPELIEGETYTIIVGDNIIETVIATIDKN
ncbi:hypothetical protein BCR32DRAFT_329963 [Anaeromyces robustus]|uniref:Carbohydrate-binding domain-containing protein n=1 Tax=Anaeromyces robustus TaxID=1754192 RepID=A0A1Y1WNC5_9FUNG|nr:hypothetical protein BCR32DRAFT_329963 [Anaeromyces robustus]|eukprot:ORX75067.1 hypothetical protein BCR32DRAFT_329963 [Anaeromyces robustus]